MDTDEFLAHYGVPGMRWGHRKSDTSSGGKKAAGPELGSKKAPISDSETRAGRRWDKKVEKRYQKVDKLIEDSFNDDEAKAVLQKLDLPTSTVPNQNKGFLKYALSSGIVNKSQLREASGPLRGDKKKQAAYALLESVVFSAALTVGLNVVQDEMDESDTDKFLSHYGIPGMRWGYRRPRGANGLVNKSAEPTVDKSKVKEGESSPSKSSGTKSVKDLSNKELQDLVTRLNLEKQLANLQPAPKATAKDFIKETLVDIGKQQVKRTAGAVAAKKVDELLDKAGYSSKKPKTQTDKLREQVELLKLQRQLKELQSGKSGKKGKK